MLCLRCWTEGFAILGSRTQASWKYRVLAPEHAGPSLYINLKVHVDGAGISPQMQRKCAYSLKGKWALPEVCIFVGCPAQRHQCAWTALAQALYSPVRSIFKVRELRLPAI